MQIIVMPDRLGPTRTFHFNPRHALIATIILLAALVWSGFLGFRFATDGGAGVTWRTLEMTLDGEPILAEWDPEAARFVAHLRADPAPGEHAWVVRAADRVGNRAERSLIVTVR